MRRRHRRLAVVDLEVVVVLVRTYNGPLAEHVLLESFSIFEHLRYCRPQLGILRQQPLYETSQPVVFIRRHGIQIRVALDDRINDPK